MRQPPFGMACERRGILMAFASQPAARRVRFKVMRRMLAIRGSMEIWQNGGGETQRRGAFGTS
jgi:hypothetical protein